MTFEEAKQQAIDRSEWVLCHGAGYYTARTPATEAEENVIILTLVMIYKITVK